VSTDKDFLLIIR